MADSPSYSLDALNQMSQDEFTHALGAVFEETPAIAHQSWKARPFTSIEELHEAMVAVVRSLSPDDQLALIKAHPDLGNRAKMADASVQEQAGAGLDQLTTDEYERIQQLNQAYKDKFQFPFIVAVKNHTKDSIFENFAQRLTHDIAAEQETALSEIVQIARFRLNDWVDAPESKH
ncbi:MAG: 2-oxo-4-hydroxy-4-carboxy-5-ureidoimidazoline decarboxylase [Elainellaceae cyanobacterium]